MIHRYLKIKNFRNIGNGVYEKLELNIARTAKDKLGGIVTLIGMNNAGKSNYLDALETLDTKNLKDTDFPYYNYDSDIETSIVMGLREIKDKDDSKIEYQYKLKKDNVYIEKLVNGKLVEKDSKQSVDNKAKIDSNTVQILSNIKNNDLYNRLTSYNNSYRNNTHTRKQVKSIPFKNVDEYIILIQKILDDKANMSDYEKLVNFMSIKAFNEVAVNHMGVASPKGIEYVINQMNAIIEEMNSSSYINEVSETYGVSLIPNITKYDDSITFKQNDMVSHVSANGLENAIFFKTLYNVIETRKFDELENAYRKFLKKPTSIHPLTNYERELNKELSGLAKIFNRVYGQENDKKFGFKLKLESSKVFFILSENENDVPYESQSTGFKWFFNFFFNVFANEALQSGDIVIMDEPATNLHVSGQVELRKQIRDFGIKNGITFVVSTHSPFLIDMDYLDEIRIVSKDGMNSVTDNKFSVSDKRMIDVLMPLQSSLTIAKHVINDPNKTLIFVEGITDYNYLVAFKEHFGLNNLAFLPVQGVKDSKKVFTILLESFSNPIILVDSDTAGKMAEKESGNGKYAGLEVRTLNEISSDFNVIEDLFKEDDEISKFLSVKKYDRSTYFKNYFVNFKNKLSEKTFDNFKELLKNLAV